MIIIFPIDEHIAISNISRILQTDELGFIQNNKGYFELVSIDFKKYVSK